MGQAGSNTLSDHGLGLGSFKAQYLGSVPVKHSTGMDVVKDGLLKVRALGLPHRAVEIRPTTQGVFVIDARTKDLLTDIPIFQITFVAVDPDNACTITLMSNDQKLRLKRCHAFVTTPKAARLIPACINEGFKIHTGSKDHPATKKEEKRLKRQLSSVASLKSTRRASKPADANPNSASWLEQGVERGRLLRSYPCKYLGSVHVTSSGAGEHVAKGTARILAGKGSPRAATINIFSERFELSLNEAAADAPALQSARLFDVSYTALDRTRTRFSYIINDSRLGDIDLSIVEVEAVPEGTASVKRAVFNAKCDKLEAAKGLSDSVDVLDEGEPPEEGENDDGTGQVIGAIAATFLGGTHVNSRGEDDVVSEAIRELATEAAYSPQLVVIQLSTEGVRVIASLSNDSLMSFPFGCITFCAPCPVPKPQGGRRRGNPGAGQASSPGFSFVVKDHALGIFTCYGFALSSDGVLDLEAAMVDSYGAVAEEQKRFGDNPFKAYGGREPAPGRLFKRQIHRVNLHAHSPIGAGQFGQVYMASQVEREGHRIHRAVKTLRGGASADARAEFVREAEVMLDLQHESLVTLVGVAVQQRPWLMVLEYLEYGDVRSVLRACAIKAITLTNAEQLELAAGPADGLAYLARQGFLHMDIAARNLLLGANNVVKVADFGLTRQIPEGGVFQAEPDMKFPIKWCPPESLEDRHFSVASDVWAFGVCIWEIARYGVMPYLGIPNHQVLRALKDGTRLQHLPDRHPPAFKTVCDKCFLYEPLARPTFDEVAADLREALLAAVPDEIRDIGLTIKCEADESVEASDGYDGTLKYTYQRIGEEGSDDNDGEQQQPASSDDSSSGSASSPASPTAGYEEPVVGFGGYEEPMPLEGEDICYEVPVAS